MSMLKKYSPDRERVRRKSRTIPKPGFQRPPGLWLGGLEGQSPSMKPPTTNQTISPRKNPSAGSGTHFLGRSERLIGATE